MTNSTIDQLKQKKLRFAALVWALLGSNRIGDPAATT